MKSFLGIPLVIWGGLGFAQLSSCSNQQPNRAPDPPPVAAKSDSELPPDSAVAPESSSAPKSPRFLLTTLKLPRAPAQGEAILARITVGKLRRGETIVVQTSKGETLGSISLVGIRPGQKAGVYSIPVPRSAIVNQTVPLQLEVIVGTPETSRRPASGSEVENVTLEIAPSTSGERKP